MDTEYMVSSFIPPDLTPKVNHHRFVTFDNFFSTFFYLIFMLSFEYLYVCIFLYRILWTRAHCPHTLLQNVVTSFLLFKFIIFIPYCNFLFWTHHNIEMYSHSKHFTYSCKQSIWYFLYPFIRQIVSGLCSNLWLLLSYFSLHLFICIFRLINLIYMCLFPIVVLSYWFLINLLMYGTSLSSEF